MDLEHRSAPPGGWPGWVRCAPYVAAAHPQAEVLEPLSTGANCQRYAYAVLALFGREVRPHRSSELWADRDLVHVPSDEAEDLDLVLFNDSDGAWGAHVAVVLGDRLLHLCAEVGRPAFWTCEDFAARPRYSRIVGVVRAPVGLLD